MQNTPFINDMIIGGKVWSNTLCKTSSNGWNILLKEDYSMKDEGMGRCILLLNHICIFLNTKLCPLTLSITGS